MTTQCAYTVTGPSEYRSGRKNSPGLTGGRTPRLNRFAVERQTEISLFGSALQLSRENHLNVPLQGLFTPTSICISNHPECQEHLPPFTIFCFRRACTGREDVAARFCITLKRSVLLVTRSNPVLPAVRMFSDPLPPGP